MPGNLAQPAYMEPEKVKARELALGHAVKLLTERLADAAVVSRDYVRTVKKFLMREGESNEREVARLCTGKVIDSWEAFWESHVGQKRPGDLTVAYLAGPNPLNDFRELVRNGVHPYNIWSFESASGPLNAALREIKASEFPLLKIYSGTLETFLQSVPKKLRHHLYRCLRAAAQRDARYAAPRRQCVPVCPAFLPWRADY
jgi:hypothetical protein